MSRADKIRQVAQQAHDNGDCECVTITISRNLAEAMRYLTVNGDRESLDAISRMQFACFAALKGER
jgi:hypothetical protein